MQNTYTAYVKSNQFLCAQDFFPCFGIAVRLTLAKVRRFYPGFGAQLPGVDQPRGGWFLPKEVLLYLAASPCKAWVTTLKMPPLTQFLRDLRWS